jgi:hypothetical protein
MPDETTTPADDVEHDEEAEREAEHKMHAEGTGGGHDQDPPGGHDPEALEEGARRMGVKR